MILRNNAANPKFSFLKTGDPFHAHYRKMVAFNGGGSGATPATSAPSAPPDGGEGAVDVGAPAKGVVATSAQMAKPSTVGPRVAPLALPEQQYRVPRPAGLFPEEVETLMLAAQFTARNGRRFLAHISEREGSNARFDFLRPQHHLFGFFTALVDAYSKVLMPSREILDAVKAHAAPDARASLLLRLRRHAEWLAVEERKRVEKQDAEDAERMQQLSIDWHDFVVVETITFDDDDDDEQMPAASRLEPSAQPAAEPARHASAAQPDAREAAAAQHAEPAELELVDLGTGVPEPEMKIRTDYVRPAARPSGAPQTAIDPISGKEVPLSQIGEHVRISLLDPQWKEQKQLAAEKNKESNVARGDEVFANIARFAKRRTDIFGEEEGAIGEVLERDKAEREKAAKERVIWDGHAESIAHAATLAQSKLLNAVGVANALARETEPTGARAHRRTQAACAAPHSTPPFRWAPAPCRPRP